jgi:hypothetical protein
MKTASKCRGKSMIQITIAVYRTLSRFSGVISSMLATGAK